MTPSSSLAREIPWQATAHGVARVRHDWAPNPPQQAPSTKDTEKTQPSAKGSHTATAKSPLVLAASAPEGEKREGLHERVLAPSLPGCVANGRSQPAPPNLNSCKMEVLRPTCLFQTKDLETL